MGANDKKRAVSNTWPQIPETADIRDAWIKSETADNPFDQRADIEAEFDCWLEQVRAEAKAEALTEAAAYAVEWVGVDAGGQLVDLKTQTEYDDTADYLRTRAEKIRGGS